MTDPTTDPTVDPRDAPPRGGRAKKVPPLAWIILGLLVLIAIIALAQCDYRHQTPGGGDTPAKERSDVVMPQPAVDAPLTPPPAATNTPATTAPAPR